MKTTSTRALRRVHRLLPDAQRYSLRALLQPHAVGAGVSAERVSELCASYLLDPVGTAITPSTMADGAAITAWATACGFLDQPVVGNFVPFSDDVVALLAAPYLTVDDRLHATAERARFAPHATEAIAIAVSLLSPAMQVQTIERLLADRGPDADVLELSLLQCGRCVAWSPALAKDAIGETIAKRLLALLDRERPRPLLDEVVAALGPIARYENSLGELVRRDVMTRLVDATNRIEVAKISLSAQVQHLSKSPEVRATEYWKREPDREIAVACARILGQGAPRAPQPFATYRNLVLDGRENDLLGGAFIDGLIAAAHTPALTGLAAALLDGDGGDESSIEGLTLATRYPLDGVAAVVNEWTAAEIPEARALALRALAQMDVNELSIDERLQRHLHDSSPHVVAVAARELIARGYFDVVATAAESLVGPDAQHAAVRIAVGDLSVPVVTALLRAVLEPLFRGELDAVNDDPLAVALTDALLTSDAGMQTCAAVLDGVPETAILFALALGTRALGTALLPTPITRTTWLAVVTKAAAIQEGLASDDGNQFLEFVLYAACRFGAVDETVLSNIRKTWTISDDDHQLLFNALGELRVRSPATAALLHAHLDANASLQRRVMAAAVAGRCLPPDDNAWPAIRELLTLGTMARAVTWISLRDRARFSALPMS